MLNIDYQMLGKATAQHAAKGNDILASKLTLKFKTFLASEPDNAKAKARQEFQRAYKHAFRHMRIKKIG